MRARDVLRAAVHSVVEYCNEGEFFRVGAGGIGPDGRRRYGAGIVLDYMADSMWPERPSRVYRVGRVTFACWWPS